MGISTHLTAEVVYVMRSYHLLKQIQERVSLSRLAFSAHMGGIPAGEATVHKRHESGKQGASGGKCSVKVLNVPLSSLYKQILHKSFARLFHLEELCS